MTKYPFLLFSEDNQETCCCFVLPVSEGSDIILYNSILPNSFTFSITNVGGNAISGNYNSIDGKINLTSIDLSVMFAPGDCFRIRCLGELSNTFQYIGCNTENTHVFEFWDEAGEIGHQRVRLRCVLDTPQSKTQKSEYIDSNGVVHSLSKTRRKEYSLETDFYTEYMHDSIKEMLIYPNLLVDDELMYESGDYDIDWGEKDENGYAKGSTSLSDQSINRYSIC